MFTRALALTALFVLTIIFTAISVFAEGVWTTYSPIVNADSMELSVNSIAVDKNNVMWFGANGGAYSFDGHGGTILYKENGLVSNDVQVVAVDKKNIKWFGTTDGGISTYDDNNGRPTLVVWRTYTIADGLVDNHITSIAFDKDNVAWIGTTNGVSSFDGTIWKTYTVVDGLADDYVCSIAIDADNVKWFGTNGGGVSSFDGTTWKNYTDKDGLAHGIVLNLVTSVSVDTGNVKWFGTGGGISSFDGATLKNYYVSDYVLNFSDKLEHYFIQAIAVDARNTKWFGMTDGVASFDGTAWKVYTIADGLAGNSVWGIAVDSDNVKWFLTDGGRICSFDDRTLTSVEESAKTPESINLRGNFPNPFNPSTTIKFSIGYENQVAIDIYSIAGQKIKTLINGRLAVGIHSVVWNGKDEAGTAVSSGTYFYRMVAGNLTQTRKMTLLR